MNAPDYPNFITDYTTTILTSEAARSDGVLANHVGTVLNGHCFYHKNMLCPVDDYTLLHTLLQELYDHEKAKGDTNSILHWNNHYKYEDPSFSPTFQLICKWLGEYFDLEVLATRLNIYMPSDHKSLHHDSHRYGSDKKREDCTVGVSLGATRALTFFHPTSKQSFDIPQTNGDVFAFDSLVNSRFMHGVPKLPPSNVDESYLGPRLSIICWGRRKTLNARNCGENAGYGDDTELNSDEEYEEKNEKKEEEEKEETATKHHSPNNNNNNSYDKPKHERRVGVPLDTVIAAAMTWTAMQQEKYERLKKLTSHNAHNIFNYSRLFPSLLTIHRNPNALAESTQPITRREKDTSQEKTLVGGRGLTITIGKTSNRFQLDSLAGGDNMKVYPRAVTVTHIVPQQ